MAEVRDELRFFFSHPCQLDRGAATGDDAAALAVHFRSMRAATLLLALLGDRRALARGHLISSARCKTSRQRTICSGSAS